uniref:Uncharacterized protein n=1 Tax=Oryza nivara TaxID=4536 RepID=A0A0E0J5A2_ORYNI
MGRNKYRLGPRNQRLRAIHPLISAATATEESAGLDADARAAGEHYRRPPSSQRQSTSRSARSLVADNMSRRCSSKCHREEAVLVFGGEQMTRPIQLEENPEEF